MKRSRFDVHVYFNPRVPWPMIAVCAAVGLLPLAVGWVTYQLSEAALGFVGERRR